MKLSFSSASRDVKKEEGVAAILPKKASDVVAVGDRIYAR